MSQRRYRKVTSGSGKSHQGRRITMAQPVSSVIGDLVRSSRSIAHSDDFEGHKSIQTNSWQQILLASSSSSSRQASSRQASSRQASSRQASSRQASSRQPSSRQASSRQASSRQASSSQQAAASKQQPASSKQAAATSVCRMIN